MYFEADKKVWKWYKKNQATRIPANIPDTSTALEYYKRLYTTRKVNTPSVKLYTFFIKNNYNKYITT